MLYRKHKVEYLFFFGKNSFPNGLISSPCGTDESNHTEIRLAHSSACKSNLLFRQSLGSFTLCCGSFGVGFFLFPCKPFIPRITLAAHWKWGRLPDFRYANFTYFFQVLRHSFPLSLLTCHDQSRVRFFGNGREIPESIHDPFRCIFRER